MQAGSEGGVAGYGWLPDPPDPRDKRIDDLALPTTPPPALDWGRAKAAVREIMHQGSEPSCVGYSIAGAIRTSIALDGLPDFAPSPRAIWFWARASQGREADYAGTTIRAGMKAIAQLGLVPASLHGRWAPYDKAPSFAALRAAYRYRGTRGYYRADDLDAVKRALAADRPVVFGMDAYQSWESYRGGTLERWSGKLLGGHATYLVSYDRGRLLGVNSYGLSFGEDGFYWISEELFDRSARDAWAADLHPEVWRQTA